MRTTVDIPDPVYRRLKAKAALEGGTVKQIILTAVQKELGATRESGRRVKPPLLKADSPGSLRLTNARINAILHP